MLLSTPQADLGWQAKPFELADVDGNVFTMESLRGENGLLVAFICNHCPYVVAVAPRLVIDAAVLKQEGINVVGINSNDYKTYPADNPVNMKRFAEQHEFTFPYLIDEDQTVAKHYGAVCTPDFFGFNKAGELAYRGRLDDARMDDATHRIPELVDAMMLSIQTGRGPQRQEASMGCSIKWAKT